MVSRDGVFHIMRWSSSFVGDIGWHGGIGLFGDKGGGSA